MMGIAAIGPAPLRKEPDFASVLHVMRAQNRKETKIKQSRDKKAVQREEADNTVNIA
jgi:hypothetical protein